MNEIQAHMVRLLGELDEICIENHIPYVLYGRTAKDACVSGTFCGEYMNASILIPGQYFPILEQQIRARFPDCRSVEWVGNNPAFPGMHMRYIDEGTTFIYGDSAHRYHHRGIYVTIERARVVPKRKINAKLADWIDKGIEYAGVENITALSRNKQWAGRLLRLGVRCLGWQRTIRMLLGLQKRLTSNPGKQIAVIRYLKDNLNLSADYLKSLKRVPFAGRNFFVPKKHGDYLNLVYGKSWKTVSPKGVTAPHLLVTSMAVSYRDLGVQISQEEQAAVGRIIQERSLLTEWMKPLKTEIEQYWNVLLMTQCRYELYRKYDPRKDELLLALEKEEYVVLELVMREALEAEEKYLNLGMVVSLGSEIDRIIGKLLSYQGKYELAQKMESLLKRFPQVPLRLEAPLQDDDTFWPERVSADASGDIPVYLRDTAGREYPVVWKVKNGLRELLRGSGKKLVPAVSQGELAARDGDRLFSLEEIFTDLLGGFSYTPLMQRDFLGREFPLAALTRAGALYPMAGLDENRLVKPIELPPICCVNPDLSVPTWVCVDGELMGEVFWKNENGYAAPVLAVGAQGKLRLVPHELGAELVYDAAGRLLPVPKDWYAPDPVKDQLMQAEGCRSCTLVQQDIFGRPVVMAKVQDSGVPLPCGRIDAGGVFREEVSAEKEYVLCFGPTQQELLPLSRVLPDGGAVPTVYAAFLQELGGTCPGSSRLPMESGI